VCWRARLAGCLAVHAARRRWWRRRGRRSRRPGRRRRRRRWGRWRRDRRPGRRRDRRPGRRRDRRPGRWRVRRRGARRIQVLISQGVRSSSACQRRQSTRGVRIGPHSAGCLQALAMPSEPSEVAAVVDGFAACDNKADEGRRRCLRPADWGVDEGRAESGCGVRADRRWGSVGACTAALATTRTVSGATAGCGSRDVHNAPGLWTTADRSGRWSTVVHGPPTVRSGRLARR
jgi:hypothetical protein